MRLYSLERLNKHWEKTWTYVIQGLQEAMSRGGLAGTVAQAQTGNVSWTPRGSSFLGPEAGRRGEIGVDGPGQLVL